MAIGSGKSVLASFVITLIQEHGETEPQVLFFFCKDSSDDTSAAASIMTNLIDQLIGQNPLKTLFQILNKARQKHAKSEKCTDFELLWKIFVAMAQEFPIRIVIVIDALDECVTDRSEFLGKILSSNKDTDGKVQFFITSRRERDTQSIISRDGHIRLLSSVCFWLRLGQLMASKCISRPLPPSIPKCSSSSVRLLSIGIFGSVHPISGSTSGN